MSSKRKYPRAVRRRPRHSTRGRGRRWPTAAVSCVAAVAAFGLGYVQTTKYHLESAFTTRDVSSLLSQGPDYATTEVKGEVTDEPVDVNAGDDITILLAGSDNRDGSNGWLGGAQHLEGMRSDTVIVLHISADRERVELLSFPRDARVRVSDCKMFDGSTVRGWTGKFNIAFANGGRNGDPAEAAACTMQTITDLTGISFDHYVVADFAGFRNMIDSIDGVPICIPHPIDAPKANLQLSAGPQVLSGRDALGFARARTGSGLGDGTDLARIDRQQALLKNTARKVLGMNLLTDAGALTGFIRSAAESLTMDPALGDVDYLVGLAYSMRSLEVDSLRFATVPWRYAGDGSGDVLWTYQADDYFEALASDKPMPTNEASQAVEGDAFTGDDGTESPSKPALPAGMPRLTPGEHEPLPLNPPKPERESQQEILDACSV